MPRVRIKSGNKEVEVEGRRYNKVLDDATNIYHRLWMNLPLVEEDKKDA